MDKTEQFIKMSDCPEVQGQRKPKVEKMLDGRWHYEWQLKVGDYFATEDLYIKGERQVEIKGTTIYNPYFYDGKQDANIDIGQVGFDEGDGYVTKKIIWLPRQDQIQEMLQPIELHELLDICGQADGVMWKALHEYAESMEQLWLAFYMWENHKKVWSSKEEKWVKK